MRGWVIAILLLLLGAVPASALTPSQRAVVLTNACAGQFATFNFAKNAGGGLYCWRGARRSTLLSVPGETFSRFSTGYASTAAGALVSFGFNQPRITDNGLLIEAASTNLFLNSFSPATQTISLSATGNYTISVWGTGSVTVAAGTATITNAGSASAGSPRTINCTGTGTISVTVAGSPTAVQVEPGGFATSPIATTGTPGTRAVDVTSTAFAYPSAFTEVFTVTLAPGYNGIYQYLKDLDDGAASNSVYFQQNNTSLFANWYAGGVGQPSMNLGPVAYGSTHTIAFSLQPGKLSVSMDGGATQTVTGTAPTLTTNRQGQYISGDYACGCYVRGDKVLSGAASPAQLKSLSAGGF